MRPSRLARNRNFNPNTERIQIRQVPKDIDPYKSLSPSPSQMTPIKKSKGYKEPKEALPPRTFDESKEDEII
jgi:hypothetical protein